MSNQNKHNPPVSQLLPPLKAWCFISVAPKLLHLSLPKPCDSEKTIALASWFLTLLPEKCSGHLAFPGPPVTVASLQTQLLSSSLPLLPLKKNKTKTTLLEELVIGKG